MSGPSIGHGRAGLSGCQAGSKNIYIFGGYSNQGVFMHEFEVLDAQAFLKNEAGGDQWQTLQLDLLPPSSVPPRGYAMMAPLSET